MKRNNEALSNDFASNNAVAVNDQKKDSKKKKSGKVNFFKRIGLKIKDVFSELKKVSWPTFPKIVKQTGVVLLVVLVFLIVITAFDLGLTSLLGLISPKA